MFFKPVLNQHFFNAGGKCWSRTIPCVYSYDSFEKKSPSNCFSLCVWHKNITPLLCLIKKWHLLSVRLHLFWLPEPYKYFIKQMETRSGWSTIWDLNLDLLAPDQAFIKQSDLPEFFKDTQNSFEEFLNGSRIN